MKQNMRMKITGDFDEMKMIMTMIFLKLIKYFDMLRLLEIKKGFLKDRENLFAEYNGKSDAFVI
ncbi:MAG: hypothetical protein MZV64_00760 [Ignavibacteriales bacterium]|nr:hypothetical protein [Ignavibacteriales bacterium]